MITFEDITSVNNTIVTMPITRKDRKTGKESTKEYAQVHQRVKAFRMLVPNGGIETEIVSADEKMAIIRAVVRDELGNILGTGTAFERQDSSFINNSSYIENAETSAVGRALAMCGIGIDLSMASFEEVSNAQLNQDKNVEKVEAEVVSETPKKEDKKADMPPRERMLEVAYKHFPEGSKNLATLLSGNKLEKLEDSTDMQLLSIYNKFGGR